MVVIRRSTSSLVRTGLRCDRSIFMKNRMTQMAASVQRPRVTRGCGCGGRSTAFLTTLSNFEKGTGTAFLIFLAGRAGRTPNQALCVTRKLVQGRFLDYAAVTRCELCSDGGIMLGSA